MVYRSRLYLITERLDEDDKYLQAIKEVNINNYIFDSNNKYQILITDLKVGDIIHFGTSEEFQCELIINKQEYFNKIDTNKYEIIKSFSKSSVLGKLIITIDNMPKTMYVYMYM